MSTREANDDVASSSVSTHSSDSSDSSRTHVDHDANGPRLSGRVQAWKEKLQAEVSRRHEVGIRDRRIDVAMQKLSVRGLGSKEDLMYGETVGSMFNPFGKARDKKKAQQLSEAKQAQHSVSEKKDSQQLQDSSLKQGERYLIQNINSLVRAGELMLVVGRPGSGTTTFLKTVAGLTSGYAGVDGKVLYNNSEMDSLGPSEKQVLFLEETDVFFASLKVQQTLDYATALNVPSARAPVKEGEEKSSPQEYIQHTVTDLLDLSGLSHTRDTKVGDQFIRGVSGGERRRISVCEALTNGSALAMWDNASRGLDASTALNFVEVLRVLSDVLRNTNIVSLYQAGNAIYELFDRVLVLAEGQVIYYGRRSQAKGYFEDMGFECAEGANVADFLTGVTVTSERKIRKGRNEEDVPTAIIDFVKAYEQSNIGKEMRQELKDHLAAEVQRNKQDDDLHEAVMASKQKSTRKKSAQLTGFSTQLKAALKREYQLRWSDKPTLLARIGTTFILSFIYGSTFYMMPESTAGIFTRGGVCFLSLLQPALQSLAETQASFEGRGVLAKHQGMKLLSPSVVILAQTLADLPIFFLQFVQFSLVIYWMSAMRQSASAYFIFLLFIYVVCIAMTAIFRLIGSLFNSFADASKLSGFLFSVLVTYAGYIIAVPDMRPWFSWFRWINIFFYGFEGLMTEEFTDRTFACVPPQLAPYGAGYENGPAGCAFAGSTFGSTTIQGNSYLTTQLSFSRSHLWRNFGIICALALTFIVTTMAITERLKPAGSQKSYLLYKRGAGEKIIKAAKQNDLEKNDRQNSNEKSNGEDLNDKLETGKTIFTWRRLNYTINGRQLLENVEGYVRPGELLALMGASGSGKTTLMDCLALRKDEGELEGEILVNGRPLPVSFQRTTGYCEQMDVHQPEATVREALEFSALLRQPRHISDEEKLKYVDSIIDLLEMHDIADALVGTPDAGLSVEQRKRLTIGVELVSKPLLLYLDEPTSGLDGQSSFLIIGFLRKLAKLGQSCICVIHQPSASLFNEFDKLLLLKSGGQTVYFGPVKEVTDYFKSNGASEPKSTNPAEYMIDVVSGDSGEQDWAQVWQDSEQHKQLVEDLDKLKDEASSKEQNGEGKLSSEADEHRYASPWRYQFKLVLHRANIQLWRQTDYIKSKIFLHIGSALFNGFSFFLLGNRFGDLQARVFTVFTFIFVAPGVIAQTQPKFIANRDVFETREKKAMIYSWQAFIFAEIVSELPYLMFCALIYWVCWYFAAGLILTPDVAGPVFLEMCMYELLYTGIGQFIAAYAPNPTFASLINPFLISILVIFCGVLAPFQSIPVWWRDWLYYLNPFTFLVGSIVAFVLKDVRVECAEYELARFAPPAGQTCGQYMQAFLQRSTGYLVDPSSTTECGYCLYSTGTEYLATLNLPNPTLYGWRNIAITFIFVCSSYGLVFIMMKLRSKATKSAK